MSTSSQTSRPTALDVFRTAAVRAATSIDSAVVVRWHWFKSMASLREREARNLFASLAGHPARLILTWLSRKTASSNQRRQRQWQMDAIGWRGVSGLAFLCECHLRYRLRASASIGRRIRNSGVAAPAAAWRDLTSETETMNGRWTIQWAVGWTRKKTGRMKHEQWRQTQRQ